MVNNTIWFDFDNTLVNSTMQIVDMYNNEYDESVDWTKVYNWNFEDQCKQITLQDIDRYFGSRDFFEDVDLLYDMVDLFDYYSTATSLTIGVATKGNKSNLNYKKNYIDEILFADKILLMDDSTMDKSQVEGLILVDDNSHCLKTCKCRYKILYAPLGKRQWNEDVYDLPSDETDILIVKNGYELRNLIDYILKKENL